MCDEQLTNIGGEIALSGKKKRDRGTEGQKERKREGEKVRKRERVRHPLRAETAPVQSQHIAQHKKVTESQKLRHLETEKFYLLLPRSHFRPFASPRLQTGQCLRPEEKVQPLVTGIVILPSWLPQHFDGLRSRQELLFFLASRSHLHPFHFI